MNVDGTVIIIEDDSDGQEILAEVLEPRFMHLIKILDAY